jgi:hypothetical protein
MSYEVGDKFIDKDGFIATIHSLEPFEFIVDYGFTYLSLYSKHTFSRFVKLTELTKALI